MQKVEESDKARAVYHDFFTGYKWGTSQNYDLTINCGLGIETCVSTILNVISGMDLCNGEKVYEKIAENT